MRATDAHLPPARLSAAAQRSLETAVRRGRLLEQLAVDLAKARTLAVDNDGGRFGRFWHEIAQRVVNDIRAVRAPGWRP